MRIYFSLLFSFFFLGAFAQDEVQNTVVDSLYREDQFYVNLTYNSYKNAPKDLSQSKFSSGFAAGFLRDMPINKNRTWAIAAGLGYSLSIINNNVLYYKADADIPRDLYVIIPNDFTYSKNRWTLQYIDLPIEIRWRNSTFQSHKFWRIYSGFKVSYLVGSRYKFVADTDNLTTKNIPNLNKLQYGCYLAVGWNTWNVYAYYGLNSIIKPTISDFDENTTIKMNTLNIGLQFYIL